MSSNVGEGVVVDLNVSVGGCYGAGVGGVKRRIAGSCAQQVICACGAGDAVGSVVERSCCRAVFFGVREGVDLIGESGQGDSLVGQDHSGVDLVECGQCANITEGNWSIASIVGKDVISPWRTAHAVNPVEDGSCGWAWSARVRIAGDVVLD